VALTTDAGIHKGWREGGLGLNAGSFGNDAKGENGQSRQQQDRNDFPHFASLSLAPIRARNALRFRKSGLNLA
jgi:hypothetical protein